MKPPACSSCLKILMAAFITKELQEFYKNVCLLRGISYKVLSVVTYNLYYCSLGSRIKPSSLIRFNIFEVVLIGWGRRAFTRSSGNADMSNLTLTNNSCAVYIP